jgi:predicted RNase H-like HicB family nuclease/uncharacterized damage-inducible protein DinB
MTRYHIYLETSAETLAEGGYLAHAPELVGCVARDKTKEGAVEKIREAIRAYHAWLRQNNLPAPAEGEPVELDITEVTEGGTPTYLSDYTPLRDAELDDLWHRAALSRQRLLDTLNTMPPDALGWKPDAEAWAIGDILAHIARADLWYASRLEEGGLPELLWRLAATRALLIRHLQELPAEARGRVTTHDGEEWTPHKVIRRMLEHEAEHLEQIREILGRYA